MSAISNTNDTRARAFGHSAHRSYSQAHHKTFRLVLILFFTCSFGELHAQSITQILVNSSVIGTTRDLGQDIQVNYSNKDVVEQDVGQAGKAIHQLRLQGINNVFSVEMSTCEGSEFDTYLVVLTDNPLNKSFPRVIAESANDINCDKGVTRAFVSARLYGGTYYIMVTGNGAQEGKYNLTVTAQLESSSALPWGLDRIDQRRLPLDKSFNVKDSGQGTWIYLIDSGVRLSHEEFEGRAESGYDFVNNRDDRHMDCTGHGTHMAGIIAGKTYGIAKKARIVSLRVYGCDRSAKTASIINALDWAVYHWTRTGSNGIIVLSLNTKTPSETLRSIVASIIRRGIPVVVPAGDDAESSCEGYPASEPNVLTIGSTDSMDRRSGFSNRGNCTDLYAPGSGITSAWHTSDGAKRTVSGTAQAAAHVAGIMSHLLVLNEGLLDATQVRNVMKSISTHDVVKYKNGSDVGALAFVRSVPAFSGTPPREKRVLLMCVLRANVSSCEAHTSVVQSMRKAFAQAVEVASTDDVSIECKADERIDASAFSKRVQVRIEVEERKAGSAFGLLERALGEQKGTTEEVSGIELEVVEQAWAVDSRRIVFWGAPSFGESESRSLSKGAVVGMIVSVVCVTAVIGVAGWMWIRKVRRVDDIEAMEGSMDVERGRVEFDDYGSDDGKLNVMRSFRNVVRQMSRHYMSGGQRGQSGGINQMGSFIGGEDRVQKELVEMQSFGGEAFAGMMVGGEDKVGVGRSGSGRMKSSWSGRGMSGVGEGSVASFRGWDNLVLGGRGGADGDGDGDGDDEVRMRSVGGEAFAVLGGMHVDSHRERR
ncbi:Extracellular serine proteinase [Gracilariopsis chorda]|uniref:Extracellular serine proteinase n=1 Tax=Gracilariopsis chorda TaxID=448386 RepID=A0A2V3IHH8_9FLOR|nr:Extracellular serine proteinase [Gracilariopsis chorda]|eukprot:PXF41566.1 Extracellular serine proteinase [Gracilariopsis chorda]